MGFLGSPADGSTCRGQFVLSNRPYAISITAPRRLTALFCAVSGRPHFTKARTHARSEPPSSVWPLRRRLAARLGQLSPARASSRSDRRVIAGACDQRSDGHRDRGRDDCRQSGVRCHIALPRAAHRRRADGGADRSGTGFALQWHAGDGHWESYRQYDDGDKRQHPAGRAGCWQRCRPGAKPEAGAGHAGSLPQGLLRRGSW